MLTRLRNWIARLINRTARGDDAPPAWSVYVRKGTNKSLPLSPFLDPARLAKRRQHGLPKPNTPVYEELDEFRKKLADNPYGKFRYNPTD
jgi:hypothetical protein